MCYNLIMKRRLLVISGVVAVIVSLISLGYLFQSSIYPLSKKSEEFLNTVLPQRVKNPGPLRFVSNSFSSNLTRNGVLTYTNEERVKAGLPTLSLNDRLNIAAENKVDDMFNRKYFAHISPDGVSASDLARDAGYEYIVIGENLALGNFKDDKELVEAWMASPGHRANILTKKYEDIGIAVKSGEFEGKTVWLAVQTFGIPESSCGSVDVELKNIIEENREKITTLESDLIKMKAEIDSTEPKKGREYNLKLEEYNLVVNEYNALVKKMKEQVGQYNIQVDKYNSCAEGV